MCISMQVPPEASHDPDAGVTDNCDLPDTSVGKQTGVWGPVIPSVEAVINNIAINFVCRYPCGCFQCDC